MKEEESNHRAKYHDQKLEDVFPSTLGYCFQKIGGAIEGEPGGFGTMHVRLVAKLIEDFKDRLSDRGTLEAYTSFVNLIEFD